MADTVGPRLQPVEDNMLIKWAIALPPAAT